MARERGVDLLAAAAETPRRAEHMLFTYPYLEFPGVIIAPKGGTGRMTLEKLRGKKIATVSGYAAHEFLGLADPELGLILVDDVRAGLRMVSFGQVDAFIGDRARPPSSWKRRGSRICASRAK